MYYKIKIIRCKGTYSQLLQKDLDAKNNKILLLIQVFKYKLNNKGYLKKYKARIYI